MSKIVLHIGTHKTGTTFIQSLFKSNAKFLADHNVIVPSYGRGSGQHALVSVWNENQRPHRRFNAIQEWADLSRKYGQTNKTVFVSSEEFSRLSPHRPDMKQLRKLLRGFHEVSVVCVLRDQASFIQSVYHQVSRRKNIPSVTDYLNQALAANRVDGLSIHYSRLYSHLLTGFKRHEIHFVSYDVSRHNPFGLLEEFAEIMGLSAEVVGALDHSKVVRNASNQPLVNYVANAIASEGPRNVALLDLVRSTFDTVCGNVSNSTIFSRAEVDMIEAHCASSNRALEERLIQYQPGFHLPKMDRDDRLMYREDIPPEFWITLSQRLVAKVPSPSWLKSVLPRK